MAERSKYENLELTTEQVMELAGPMTTLVQSSAWAIYQELLKGRRIQYREILYRVGKEQYDHFTGIDAGLTEAAELPETILKLANMVNRREEATERLPRRRISETGDSGGPTFG